MKIHLVIQFCLSLKFLLVFVSIANGNQQLEQYVDALKQISISWANTQSEFSTQLENSENVMTTKVGINADGTLIRWFQEVMYEVSPASVRTQQSWKFVNEEIIFRRSLSWLNSEENQRLNHTAHISGKVPNPDFVGALTPVQFFYGVDKFSGEYWYKIVEHSDSQTLIHKSNQLVELSVTNPKFGAFQFFFSEAESPSLVRVVGRRPISSVRDSDSLITTKYEISGVNYSDFFGKTFIGSFDRIVETTSQPNQGETVTTKHQKLVNVQKLVHELTDRIEFPDIRISNGTPVNVLNDKGIPYEFRDGYVVRVIDRDMVIEGDSARFRKPEGFSVWWYVIFGVVLAAGSGILIYLRIK